MKLHIVSLSTVRISICPGCAISSSNTTSKLSFGFKKDLGMWYLIQTNNNQWKTPLEWVSLNFSDSFTYSAWVGFPRGDRKFIQWRPMLLPFTQTIPFPIPVILMARGSLPSGLANLVCKMNHKLEFAFNLVIISYSTIGFVICDISQSITLYQETAGPAPMTGLHFTLFDPSSVKIRSFSPLRPTCKINICHSHMLNGDFTIAIAVSYWQIN